MVKVIIFDLDGLLIDSQPLQYQAYHQVFSNHGFLLTLVDWQEWIHNSYSAKQWIQKHKLPLDVATLRSEKKTIYDQLIHDELKLKPGARKLINTLYGKFRLGIASASRLESIELIVDKFGLRSKFEQLVSDTEMANGKPHPDIFLETAQAMQVEPADCLVIEDSMAGLKAAKAANMTCIICPDTFSNLKPATFTGADKIVSQLDEITCAMIDSLDSARILSAMGYQGPYICQACGNTFQSRAGGGFLFIEYRCVNCDAIKTVKSNRRVPSSEYTPPTAAEVGVCEQCGGELKSDLQPMCPACKSRDVKESGGRAVRYD